MRAAGNEGRVRCWLSDGDRMRLASVARIAALGVNVMLVAGGIALVIWQSLGKFNAIALYEATGGYANNDVTRGYSIGILSGLGITLLASIALVGVRKGNRWGCWIDVLIWFVMWLPASIGLNMYLADGFGVASLVCSLGITFAIATYLLLSESSKA
ncbi:hypothetical protein [Arthrobacter psychrolactophilus]